VQYVNACKQTVDKVLQQGGGDPVSPLCPRKARGLRTMRGSWQTVLLARRAPTIKQWSLDARSKEQSAYSLLESLGIRRPSFDARNRGSSRPPPERDMEWGKASCEGPSGCSPPG